MMMMMMMMMMITVCKDNESQHAALRLKNKGAVWKLYDN
jgi:hypothetical protein